MESLLLKAACALCRALHKKGPQVLGQKLAEIIEKHSIGASVTGLGAAWIPGVGGTAALVCSAGFVWSMYYRIGEEIGIPFSKNILKSVGTAIAANLSSSAIASVVISSLASLFPGLGNVAASVMMAGVVFSLTWGCGLVYLKVLTSFAERNVDLNTVTEDELKAMAEDVMAKEDLKAMMKQAKRQFNKARAQGKITKNGNHVKPMEE